MNSPILFPEITRDEVFRLETTRLWLRWPTVGDASVMQPWCSLSEVAQWTSTWAIGASTGQIAERLARVRASNALGSGLSLAITPRGDNARVVGMLGLWLEAGSVPEFGYQLDPDWRGRGLMPEAVGGLAQMAFWLLRSPRLGARVVIGNTASRRVLERCGFVLVGDEVSESQLYGTRPVHRFELLSPTANSRAEHMALAG